jgi:hypothetical protein
VLARAADVPVEALNCAPSASTSADSVVIVGLRSVPVKSMCSTKWAVPRVSRLSYREPVAKPRKHATDWACGIGAVRMRTPFARVPRSNITGRSAYMA